MTLVVCHYWSNTMPWYTTQQQDINITGWPRIRMTQDDATTTMNHEDNTAMTQHDNNAKTTQADHDDNAATTIMWQWPTMTTTQQQLRMVQRWCRMTQQWQQCNNGYNYDYVSYSFLLMNLFSFLEQQHLPYAGHTAPPPHLQATAGRGQWRWTVPHHCCKHLLAWWCS